MLMIQISYLYFKYFSKYYSINLKSPPLIISINNWYLKIILLFIMKALPIIIILHFKLPNLNTYL